MVLIFPFSVIVLVSIELVKTWLKVLMGLLLVPIADPLKVRALPVMATGCGVGFCPPFSCSPPPPVITVGPFAEPIVILVVALRFALPVVALRPTF